MNDVKMHNDDEQSEKVALLFEECIDIPDPVKRAAFLDTACSESPEIRLEVQRLLRAHEHSGKFLFGGTFPSPEKWSERSGIDPTDLEPGGRVGPYRLLGLIGEGSTSTVFLAEQEDPVHRWVALKIVKPGMDSRKVIQRFGLERQALALMDHPGIAKLLDAGATSSGRPFFVMELVTGSNVSTYCDDHSMTIPERLVLFGRMCSAVLHAHQRGIIHRDIKPDNVLVSDNDGQLTLKIIDFGIAKVLNTWGIENATRTGMIPFLGTPAYMSPEQVNLNAPDLDTRTDIYSLGALLYELLTGLPPFDHERLISVGLEDMFRIIKNEDPPFPSERVAGMSPEEQYTTAKARGTNPGEFIRTLKGDLDWITLKALDKKPDRRYSTAEGIAEDLNRYFKHRPVSAAAPSKRYRLIKMLKRNRRLVAGIGSAAAILIFSTIAIALLAMNTRISANQAREMEQAATKAEQLSEQAMVSMHVSSGLSAADENYHDKAFLWFANAARLADPGSYEAEINARRALSWIDKVPLPIGAFKLSSNFRTLEFSRDSRYLLAIDANSQGSLWDSQSQDLVPWAMNLGPIQAAAWSPSGSELVLAAGGEVRLYEIASGTLLRAFPVFAAPQAIGFTPDGRYLVYGNSSLHVYDLSANDPGQMALRFPQDVVGLTFSEESGKVVGISNDGGARVFEIRENMSKLPDTMKVFPHRHAIRTDACASKSNYREDFLETAVLSLPVITAAGDRLLTRTDAYQITFWDLLNGDVLHTVDGVCCSCRFIISPDSGYLACGIQGGKVQIWDIEAAEQVQLLPSRGSCILDIAFGNFGKSLVTAETNGMARLWSIDQGKEFQSPLHHSTDVDRVAYTHDGTMVATGQSDGLVRIWSVLEGEPAEHAPVEGEVPTIVRMNDSGSRFVLNREPSWDANCEACLGQLVVYSADTGEKIGRPIPVDACVEASAFSKDNDLLAVGLAQPGKLTSGRLEIHQLNESGSTPIFIDLPSRPADIAWHPNHSDITVICRGGELLSFKLDDGLSIRWMDRIENTYTQVNPMAFFARGGQDLVTLGPDRKIQVRDSNSGQLRYPALEADLEGFWSFSLSADGKLLSTTTMGGEVRVWDLETGSPASIPLLHPKWVYRCRFSPDQRTLVTASHDGKVRLWDWQSGTQSTIPMTHPNEVYDAAFTPDSRYILSACRDGNLRVWEPKESKLLTPPVRVGHQAFNIEFNSAGDTAVIGNLCKSIHLLSLSILQQQMRYDAEDLCLLSEVASSCSIEKGSVRVLTSTEWMDRFNKIKNLHPESLQPGFLHGLEKVSLLKNVIAVSPLTELSESNSSGLSLLDLTVNRSLQPDPCVSCPSGSSCSLSYPKK